MKKIMFMGLCAGSIAISACSKTEKTDSDTATVINNDQAAGTGTSAATEAMYRDRAEKTTRRMATDLKFDNDTALQSRARNAYYTRAARMEEIRRRHTEDTTGIYMELRTVELETDREFQSFLAPEQFSQYQANRTTYFGSYNDSEMMTDNTETNATASGGSTANTSMGPGTTVQTKRDKDGDVKTEIEGPNGQVKIKRDADGEVKVKRSPNN